MLLLLSTISPLNVRLLQNFLASFLLTNIGIFMLITFTKRPRKTIGFIHRSFHSAPINIRRTLYTLPWSVLSLEMPLTPGIPSRRGLLAVLSCSNGISHDELLQESDLPTLAILSSRCCHSLSLVQIFHGLCSSPNPYRPHPRPSLRHLSSCAVNPPFAVCLFQRHLFTRTLPPYGITCPKPLLSPLPSKPFKLPVHSFLL